MCFYDYYYYYLNKLFVELCFEKKKKHLYEIMRIWELVISKRTRILWFYLVTIISFCWEKIYLLFNQVKESIKTLQYMVLIFSQFFPSVGSNSKNRLLKSELIIRVKKRYSSKDFSLILTVSRLTKLLLN